MDVARPRTWDEALRFRADHPELVPVCGGTDVMVDVNFGRIRPTGLLDLTRVEGAAGWQRRGDGVRLGAGVSYRTLVDELGDLLPGLAAAARTVGSPQIRNRGTVGGNLGSASPAGDAHPPLLAAGATVEIASVAGIRVVRVEDFFTGPKRSVLRPGELVTAVRVPVARGPQAFSKVGTRNAMVIAVTALATAVDPGTGTVGTGIGSAGPTPLRAREAEDLLAGSDAWWAAPAADEALVREFGRLVAAAAAPVNDVRGTATYRRHALEVLARRHLRWAGDALRGARCA